MVEALIVGPQSSVTAKLAFDTGAMATTISPELALIAGYSRRDAVAFKKVVTAHREEQDYLLPLARFSALGFSRSPFRVFVGELAWNEEVGKLDGLLGLNFLRYFNYEIRSADGRILVEEA